MHKSIPFWQIAGFLFTSVTGTLLHFLFGWSGETHLAALFSPINESVWEHMKLIYYPMVLFAWIEYQALGKERAQFWAIKLRGILLALCLIPSMYYIYTGISGKPVHWLNIMIFYLSAGIAFRLECRYFLTENAYSIAPKTAITLLILIGLIFMLFTFHPPVLPIFRDPINGGYGYTH